MSPSTKRILARQRPGYTLTEQLIFDAGWRNFILRNKPPARAYGACVYLTPDGRKCVVGLCFPPKHPAFKIQGSMYHISLHCPTLVPRELANNSIIQYELHDGLCWDDEEGKGYWRDSLKARRAKYIEYAKLHNLTIPRR